MNPLLNIDGENQYNLGNKVRHQNMKVFFERRHFLRLVTFSLIKFCANNFVLIV